MIVTTLFLMYEKPVRPGVYQLARIDGIPRPWAYWDGMQWGWTAETPEIALLLKGLHGSMAGRPGYHGIIGWRGLAENPNA